MFISSNFNYCLVSWMFCGKTNLNKMEKLQERAPRFVFRDTTSSYEYLFTRDFLPLSLYRIRYLGIKVYKFFNGLNPDSLNNLFNQPCLKYELRDSHRLVHPKFNAFIYGLRSFRYYGSKLWNVLMYCHFQWNIRKNYMYLRKTLLSGVIVHSADLLMWSDILIVLIFASFLIFRP